MNGRKRQLEALVLDVEEIARRIAPVFDAVPVQRAYLFGSYARGDARFDSDVDLCYDLFEGEHLGGFGPFAKLHKQLETALGCPVDLLATPQEGNSLPSFRRDVERDRRLVYERSSK